MHDKFLRPGLLALSLCVTATCATAPAALSNQTVALPETVWRLDKNVEALRETSCPAGTAFEAPVDLEIIATPLMAGPESAVKRALPDSARVAGLWELTSPNKNLGGLSGLAVREDGGLLALSDAGALIWIDLDKGAPSATGKISYLRDAQGDLLSGKRDSDSEGLSYRDGMAFISFERRHRVEAYDLSGCGGAARAALVTMLPDMFGNKGIEPNRGPEALALTSSGVLQFAYETISGGAPHGIVAADGETEFAPDTANAPFSYALVGQDILSAPDGSDMTLTLFRSYDPLRGNRNIVRWGKGDRELALKRPMAVDNFEGIAGQFGADGKLTVWIVSDDNFSGEQRTLLYAFEIDI